MRLYNFLPTDAWLRWLLAPALVFIAQATSTTYLADFWHHLARGRAIVETGELLDHDVFTFTASGQPFQDCNWLTQVGYYRLFQWGGLALVQVVNALVLAGTLALLVGHCRRVCGSLAVAAGIGVAVFLGLWEVLTIRPQTVSLFLFVLLFDLLERGERRPRLLWLAVPIMALWANMHGAFPAGLMLLGCFLAGELCRSWGEGSWRANPRLRALTLVLAGGLLATLLNPYGWGIYRYVRHTANIAGSRRIDEWLPPSLDQAIGWAFLISLLVLAGLMSTAWQWRGVRPRMYELWLLGIFLPLACGSVRMAAWWLVVIAPMISARITQLWPQPTSEVRPTKGAALSLGLLSLIIVLSLPGLQCFNPLLAWRSFGRTESDLDQVRVYLDQHVGGGRIFCRFEWGEYLSWAYHPRYQVFMDGRIEIFPDHVWDEYAMLTRGQEAWKRVLDQHAVDVLVLDEAYHARTGLWAQVQQAPDWRKTFAAGPAVVFERVASLARK